MKCGRVQMLAGDQLATCFVEVERIYVQIELRRLLLVAFLFLSFLSSSRKLFSLGKECLRILVPIVWWLLAFLMVMG